MISVLWLIKCYIGTSCVFSLTLKVCECNRFQCLNFKGKLSIHSDMYFFVNYKISVKKQNDFLKNRQDNNL